MPHKISYFPTPRYNNDPQDSIDYPDDWYCDICLGAGDKDGKKCGDCNGEGIKPEYMDRL